jgi:hypothetical protein
MDWTFWVGAVVIVGLLIASRVFLHESRWSRRPRPGEPNLPAGPERPYEPERPEESGADGGAERRDQPERSDEPDDRT